MYGPARLYAISSLLLAWTLALSPLQARCEQKPLAPENIPGVLIISAEQVVELILNTPELVVIDSRKKAEYVKGHIEGAVNILNSDLSPELLARLAPDRHQPVLLYCNGVLCLRSSDAAEKAISWGYQQIYWFRGGWKEWTEKRFPIVIE